MNIFSAITDKLKSSVASIKAGAPEIKQDEALAKRVAEQKATQAKGSVFSALPSVLQVKAPVATSSPLSSTPKIAPQPLQATTTPQGNKVISQGGKTAPKPVSEAPVPKLDTSQRLPLTDNRIGPKAETPFSVMPSNVRPQAVLQATLTKEGEQYIKDKAAGDWLDMAATTDKIVKANKMEHRKDAVSEFAADVVQAFPRAIASQVLDVAGKKEFTPDSILGQVVFGEKPVKSLFTKVDEYTAASEKFLADRGVGKDWSKGLSVGFAPLFAAGMQSLDLLPFVGGEKKAAGVAYKVASLHTAEEIMPHLKTLFGASDSLLRPIAKTLAGVTDPKEAEKIIQTFMRADIKGLAKVAEEAKPVVENITDDVIENTPVKDTFNLIKNEADPGKQKKFIQTVLDSKTATPELKEAVAKIPQKYTPITNEATLAAARELVDTDYVKAMDKVLQSESVGADISATAQVLIQKAQAAGNYDDAIKILEHIDDKARESGRLIQALSMWSKLSPEGMLKYAQKEIEKSNNTGFLGKTARKILGKSDNKLDTETAEFITKKMNDLQKIADPLQRDEVVKEVLEKISEKAPLTFGEKFNAYRYQNMLSSPRTQVRNLFANAVQAGITRPSTIAVEAGLDWIRASLTGTARTRYLKDVPEYFKSAINSLPNATQAFKEVITGARKIGTPNLQDIRMKTMPKYLTVVSRLMEGGDQFFKAILSAGEFAANKSRGMTDDLAREEADKIATYSLFRNLADPQNKSGQGYMLSAIDKTISTLNKATADHPTLKWFLPFVRTPMNVFKQIVEYHPVLGPLTMIGSNKKQEQAAKAILGGVATAIGAGFAMSGDTTWEAPKGEKDKEAFYASGRKPFSVRIGDNWVPMIYAGPFALALGLPAAIKHYTQDQNKALTDSDTDKIGKILVGQMKVFSNQTFLEGMNNYIKTVSGDSGYSVKGSLAFSSSQLLPLSGFVRYINQLIDPVIHDTKGFIDNLQKDIPGLSKKLPAKEDPEGDPAKRDWVNLLAPYDIGKHNAKYDELVEMRQESNQQKALLDEQNQEVKDQAKEFVDGLKGMADEQLAEKLVSLKKEDPDMFKKVKAEIVARAKNNSAEVEYYRDLGIDNGLRATMINRKISEIKSDTELAEFLTMLKKNKLLTEEVIKQLLEIKLKEKQKIDQ